MLHRVIPQGVCSRQMEFEIKDGKVTNVKIVGGCPGNSIAVARLVEGRDVDEVYNILHDVKCGMKGTSCSAELAKAIKKANDEEKM